MNTEAETATAEMNEFAVVRFVTAKSALAEIKAVKERAVNDAHPFPEKPSIPDQPEAPDEGADEKAVAKYKRDLSAWREEKKKILAPWEKDCERVNAARKQALADAMASIVIAEEEGHPDLGEVVIVRTHTSSRCQLVGCGKSTRAGHPFCRQHLHLRRAVPRKTGYFPLRKNMGAGLIMTSPPAAP